MPAVTGGEISNFAQSVEVCNSRGDKISYPNEDCFYGYKNTKIMHDGGVVYEVILKLSPTDSLGVDKMNFVERDRTSKGQFHFPTCGCVFKNNYSPEVSVSSGMLLELSGAKALVRKNLRVSEQHANFIFNIDAASSAEILELSFEMRELVWKEFGVWLDYEMEILGQMSLPLQKAFDEQRSAKRTDQQRLRLAEARELFTKSLKA